MSTLELKQGMRLRLFIPPESWAMRGGLVDVEVQSIGKHRRRDGRVDETIDEAVIVPTRDSNVPGTPGGVVLFVVRGQNDE